jgi:hypothetical protein
MRDLAIGSGAMSEGTWFLALAGQNENWACDETYYTFPSSPSGEVTVLVQKTEPRRLLITLSGLEKEPVIADVPMPVCAMANQQMVLALRWNAHVLHMEINECRLAPIWLGSDRE